MATNFSNGDVYEPEVLIALRRLVIQQVHDAQTIRYIEMAIARQEMLERRADKLSAKGYPL